MLVNYQISLMMALWVSLLALSSVPPASSTIGDCRSSLDCSPGGCCTIGLMRFSAPWCQPTLQLGDTCRPASSKPVLNMTLTYPNGLEVKLADAYQVLCPCREGLFCSTMSGTCMADSEDAIANQNIKTEGNHV